MNGRGAGVPLMFSLKVMAPAQVMASPVYVGVNVPWKKSGNDTFCRDRHRYR